MPDLLTAAQIEARAKLAGLSIVDVCRKAGIAFSTFYRWRKGDTCPTIDVYQRLCTASEAPQKAQNGEGA